MKTSQRVFTLRIKFYFDILKNMHINFIQLGYVLIIIIVSIFLKLGWSLNLRADYIDYERQVQIKINRYKKSSSTYKYSSFTVLANQTSYPTLQRSFFLALRDLRESTT